MPSSRVNVLVYAGNGTSTGSVRHAISSLRQFLGSNYAISTLTSDQILNEPWTASCALLVMPGGADLGYARTLNGAGNRKIKQYVQLGGTYLGLCAGGYYGSARCEFEIGQALEVVGDRELAFFPGTCRGLAFPGFEYRSEAGTRAAQLEVNQSALPGSSPALRVYYNGGGVFVDADQHSNIEVLATYTEIVAVKGGNAAVVYSKVGIGAVILTGPHPEFSALQLLSEGIDGKIIDALNADEALRAQFMKACVKKLGLNVQEEEESAPSLSKLHLSAAQPELITKLVTSWQDTGLLDKQSHEIKGENDTFIIEQPGWNLQAIVRAVEQIIPSATTGLDYSNVSKHIVTHEHTQPNVKETSHFNHDAYYSHLMHFQEQARGHASLFGSHLLYGEVVTSTSTLLEKNISLLSTLPTGLTMTATTQLAGRGRGSNVWVSPQGSLMFSIVMRHSLAISNTAPVVFVQYLAALAIVAGVKQYDKGYDKIPVKLKWPNDIYASTGDGYVKIGGILVNSSYSGGDYTLVCGIGLNVNNSAPTTSLSMLAQQAGLASLDLEKLLASILVQLEALYFGFCKTGFDKRLLQQYYASWLHSDQIVVLEEGGVRVRIKGITSDWGLLSVEELGWEDRATGRTFELQSDSNSFDFFKGLLKKKT